MGDLTKWIKHGHIVPLLVLFHPISKDVIIGWKGVRASFEGLKELHTYNIMSVNPVVHVEACCLGIVATEEFEAHSREIRT